MDGTVTIFFVTGKIISAPGKIICVPEKIVSITEKIFLASEKIFFLDDKIIFVDEKIFSATEKICFVTEKICSDRSQTTDSPAISGIPNFDNLLRHLEGYFEGGNNHFEARDNYSASGGDLLRDRPIHFRHQSIHFHRGDSDL